MSDVTVTFGAKDNGIESTIVKIKGSLNNLEQTTKRASGSIDGGFKNMVKAGAGLAVGFGAVNLAAKAAGLVIENFSDALDLGGKLNDLSARTGESAGNLMLLSTAFDNAGVGADKVGQNINKMQKFIDEIAQGSKESVETIDRLGITLDELKGKTPTEQLRVFAERISAITDPTEKTALAMKVFGKSGGELLPFLTNFSGELETAKSQLGSMPAVMDKSAQAFDAIGDNIAKIKTKGMDFAAGLLHTLAPAIQFATEMLVRFDAAGAGMKIGDVIRGAGQGMEAFNDAIKAISLNEFSLAWKIAFTALKLSAQESANSIYKNLVAAIKAASEFITTIMGPGSGMWTTISAGFDLAGASLTRSIAKSIQAFFRSLPSDGMPDFFKGIADGMQGSLDMLDVEIKNKSNQMKNAMGQIPVDFLFGLEESNKVFDETIQNSKDLIDTSKTQSELEKDRLSLKRKQLEKLQQEVAAQKDSAQSTQKSVSIAQKISEIEQDIVRAKKEGNTQKQRELEMQKVYYVALDKALKDGKSLQEAVNDGVKAQHDYVNKIAKKQKETTNELKNQTAELAKQVNFSKQMFDDISTFNQEQRIDKGGRLRDDFAEAQAKGNKAAMNRIARTIEGRESKAALNDAFNQFTGKDKAASTSLRDMAKALDIDPFGKKRKDLEKEVTDALNKKTEAMKPGKEGEKDNAKKDEPVNKLQQAVDAIKDAVISLEKKLPQPALGS